MGWLNLSAHEGAKIAGHPDHSLAKMAAISVVGGTASGVGTYQINRSIAKHQHEAPPALSATTGGMESNGVAIAKTYHSSKRKGGK